MATPYPRTIPPPAGAPPARYEKRAIPCPDGSQLYLHVWSSPTATDGVVLFLHGIGMHGAPYEAIAGAFTPHGLTLAVPDIRGHGSSSGRRARLPRRRALIRDLDLILDSLRDECPSRRPVLAGESMGGLLAAEYASERQERLAGLALMVPAFQVHPSRIMARQDLARLWTRGHSVIDTEENLRVSSRDQGFIEAKLQDPLVTHSVTISYLIRLGWSGLRWFWLAPRLRLPLWMVLAGRDRAVSNTMAQWVYHHTSTPSDLKTLRTWEDAYHTVCWDPDAPEILGELSSWVRSVLMREAGPTSRE